MKTKYKTVCTVFVSVAKVLSNLHVENDTYGYTKLLPLDFHTRTMQEEGQGCRINLDSVSLYIDRVIESLKTICVTMSPGPPGASESLGALGQFTM